ncbi:MAG: hypothetical protein ACOCT8_02315, partial [Actinomycetota bacterium]
PDDGHRQADRGGDTRSTQPLGQEPRAGLRRPPWNTARFLTVMELHSLAAPYGDIATANGLYAPGWAPGLATWGRAWEWLARRLGVPGAFHVLRVRRR